MDIYHVGVIHGASFGKVFPIDKFPFHLTPKRLSFGVRKPDHGTGWRLVIRQGHALAGTEIENPCVHHIHPPSFNMFARPDMLQPWFCHPIAPDKNTHYHPDPIPGRVV